MMPETANYQHAALWLIGPDVRGLLNMGSQYVFERGGNIDKDIADKFGEKAVIFMSITAKPADIKRMDQDKETLRQKTGCGVIFQPMKEPTVPPEYQPDLHGFDVVTEDQSGLLAEMTGLVNAHKMLLVGHTGERRILPGPRPVVQSVQKYIVMLPRDFEAMAFTRELELLVKKYKGSIKMPLRNVPGLLWWW